MSTSTLSFTKAKALTINFIKKYKNLLRDGETHKPISNDDIARYEAMSPSMFFTDIDVQSIQANFGSFYDVFNYFKSCNGRLSVMIWLPTHSSAKDLLHRIDMHNKSNEDLCNFWQNFGGWYNLTEKRLIALEKIFDQFGAKSKTQTAKKSTKKPEVVTISDTTEVQNEIAFIDFDADKFNHLMKQGGTHFDPMINDESLNSADNQIDHAINAFKLARKELEDFISELVRAKDAGAKYVVDSSWCKRKNFIFEK